MALRKILKWAKEPLLSTVKKGLQELYKTQEILYFSYLETIPSENNKLRYAIDFFTKNPDSRLCPHLLKIIATSTVDKAVLLFPLLSQCHCNNDETFKFLLIYIEKVSTKPASPELIKTSLSTLSYMFKNRKKEILNFFKVLKQKTNEAIVPFLPYGLIPLRDIKYKKFYEEFFYSSDIEKKLFTLKNLPQSKESWIVKILYDSMYEKRNELIDVGIKKIFENDLIETFLPVIEKENAKIKKLFLIEATDRNYPLPSSLIEKFLYEESEDVALLALEYMNSTKINASPENLYELFYKGFSKDFKRKIVQIGVKSGKSFFDVLIRLIEERKSNVIKDIEKTVVMGLLKINETFNLNKEEKKRLIDSILLLFEETDKLELIVTILYALKQLNIDDEKELNFVLEELKDKSSHISFNSKNYNEIVKEIHKTKEFLGKNLKRKKRIKEQNNQLKKLIRELEKNKNVIFPIRDMISLLKENISLSKREMEFIKRYVIEEVQNPFQKKERRSAMLDIISYIKPEGSKEILMKMFKKAPPELLLKIKSTLKELGVKEEFFKRGKKSWYKVIK